MTLSLCMIVKNEADVLARCLTCMVGIADEIIIVDTGSTDETKEIARRFTPHIYEFAWCDDFAAARNFSFSKATMDYTMWLDADDVIDEENRAALLRLKAQLPQTVDMVYLPYDVAFDDHGSPTLSYDRERILRTSMAYRWVGEIHEVIAPRGAAVHRDIRVQHKKQHPTEPGRNLRIFRKILAEGRALDPRQMYYYARELMFAGDYAGAIREFEAFLDGGRGWVENNIGACKDLASCQTHMGDEAAALGTLLRSFVYDAPRAELCCEIGGWFFRRAQYTVAAYWYEAATTRVPNTTSGGFLLPDCYGYLPYMQLCVCYDRLGDRAQAMAYNEKAGAIKPQDPSVRYNRAYFAGQSPDEARGGIHVEVP